MALADHAEDTRLKGSERAHADPPEACAAAGGPTGSRSKLRASGKPKECAHEAERVAVTARGAAILARQALPGGSGLNAS
jgi:hypothetical protein